MVGNPGIQRQPIPERGTEYSGVPRSVVGSRTKTNQSTTPGSRLAKQICGLYPRPPNPEAPAGAQEYTE